MVLTLLILIYLNSSFLAQPILVSWAYTIEVRLSSIIVVVVVIVVCKMFWHKSKLLYIGSCSYAWPSHRSILPACKTSGQLSKCLGHSDLLSKMFTLEPYQNYTFWYTESCPSACGSLRSLSFYKNEIFSSRNLVCTVKFLTVQVESMRHRRLFLSMTVTEVIVHLNTKH